jgi:UDP-N-acetylglucosamine acyltransferase
MSNVHPTAIIGQDVVIGAGTRIGAYAVIEDHVVLGRDNVIYPQAFIGRGTTLGDKNQVHPGAIIGHLPQDLHFDPTIETFTIIGDGNIFREHCQVHRATKAGEATRLGNGNLLMAMSHVAHDCVLGNNIVMVNQASLPGHCHVGDKVIMSGFTGIHQFCRIGRLAMLSALSVANKDLPPFFVFHGRPAFAKNINAIGLRRAGIPRESRLELQRAYKLLYRSGHTLKDALPLIEAECKSPEAQELIAFLRTPSRKGIARGPRAAAEAAEEDDAGDD